jgi:hypothetical protein
MLYWCALIKFIGTEVLTAMVMDSSSSWDIAPCIALKTNRLFGGIYRLHLHGQRIRQARNQHGIDNKFYFVYFSTLKMELICSFKMSVTFNGLHGVISQKIEL